MTYGKGLRDCKIEFFILKINSLRRCYKVLKTEMNKYRWRLSSSNLRKPFTF
jgi:hypothetical protein